MPFDRRRFMNIAMSAGGLGLLAPSLAHAAPLPDDFDALVERALALYGAPGAAITVVADGQVALARGYGVRRLGGPAKVDARTQFPIASLTKAFTVAALALLVEEGKLGWDDKVMKRLPGFELADPVASAEMSVLDLLTHHSGLGLGEGDLMLFPPTDFTRAEVVRSLRDLRPATEFRAGFAYDNVLYVAAGELVGAVSGMSWEDFVQTRLLAPLGMTDSLSSDRAPLTADRAALHARLDGPIRGVGHMAALPPVRGTAPTNPAGGIQSTAADMARWMLAQLGRGQLPNGGARLWSAETAQRMWSPVGVIDFSVEPPDPPTDPRYVLAAPGWIVLDYRGETVLMHAGDLPGACCRLMLLPARNFGLSILLNSEEETLHEALAYTLLDHRLGLPTRDYVGEGKTRDDARAARRIAKAQKNVLAPPTSPKPPARPLKGYAGRYRSSWYGDVEVKFVGDGLHIDFTRTPALKGRLVHWDGETFLTRFGSRDLEDAFVTFHSDAEGGIDRVEMKAASPSADFSYDYQDLRLVRVSAYSGERAPALTPPPSPSGRPLPRPSTAAWPLPWPVRPTRP